MPDLKDVVVSHTVETSMEEIQLVGLSNVDKEAEPSETEDLIEWIPKIEKILKLSVLLTS